MNDAAHPISADTQINWLELARLAAAGEGHHDLGLGVRRLATLAAAVHRQTVATAAAEVFAQPSDSGRVQGWTPGETPPPERGTPQDRQPGKEARR